LMSSTKNDGFLSPISSSNELFGTRTGIFSF
jgi:hypothetical protein